MVARKERIVERTNAEFQMIPDMAKALKDSQMVAGKILTH
jgi:hypothetical protein